MPDRTTVLRAVALLIALSVCLVAGPAAAQPAAEKILMRQAFPSKTAAFWPSYVASAEGFYTKLGFAFTGCTQTPFGPANRMRISAFSAQS